MMVRQKHLVVVIGLLVAFSCVIGQAQDSERKQDEIAWYDMEHCDICRNMASMKDQIHRTSCDIQMLDDGMVMVARVPRDLREAMKASEKGIEKTVARLQNGEQLDMCGFCQGYGQLMGVGAKFQKVKSNGVDITIITSSDSEVAKKIQTFAKQAKVENDKMMATLKKEAKSKGAKSKRAKSKKKDK